jgi:hypothetical protein
MKSIEMRLNFVALNCVPVPFSGTVLLGAALGVCCAFVAADSNGSIRAFFWDKAGWWRDGERWPCRAWLGVVHVQMTLTLQVLPRQQDQSNGLGPCANADAPGSLVAKSKMLCFA